MREIKFRALTSNNEWVYGMYYGDFTSTPLAKHYIKDINGYISEIKRNTLSQYTGLKDLNGKERFEGDIVKHENGSIGEIVFHRGKFTVKEKTIRDTTFYGSLDDIRWKVIGNIYENPELLRKESE